MALLTLQMSPALNLCDRPISSRICSDDSRSLTPAFLWQTWYSGCLSHRGESIAQIHHFADVHTSTFCSTEYTWLLDSAGFPFVVDGSVYVCGVESGALGGLESRDGVSRGRRGVHVSMEAGPRFAAQIFHPPRLRPCRMKTCELQEVSMESSPDFESLYRFRAGSYVLYVVLQPRCALIADPDDYGFPPAILKLLPSTIDPSYNCVDISSSGQCQFATVKLKAVETLWHSNIVDVVTLPIVRRLNPNVFKVKYAGEYAIAKIARFEFEIPYIEAETRSYQRLEGLGLAPKFLAHLSENGRPMGMLIEYLHGRPPTKDDFDACSRALSRLHSWGWAHRDINRHNFVVVGSEARLVDFEESSPATEQERSAELEKLYQNLIDESGRGAPADREDYVEGQYPMGI